MDSATQLTLKSALAAGDYEIFKGNSSFKPGNSDGYSLYIGTGGDIEVVTIKGSQVVIANVKDGEQLDLQVIRVLPGNTSASNITALELK